ncbi:MULTISPECIES: wax ester/triacylglycerol synthase domain-containing protein [unclassified Frankia]|uniref:wax ester/triacylglycerol synthase domain-containing protein n=1 Tax=unclassified Frankia TaxID=2632575 RepID=UPI001F1A4E26|nr:MULTISPECIES: wax ester/triacylglycerol synthase domain-containing protein [unclassified Frankia]
MLSVADPALGLVELRAHVAERLRDAPALLERLSRMTAPPGRDDTVWRLDDELDLEYHVRAEKLPVGSGDGGIRAALGRVAAEPLDLKRPQWRLHLLHGHSADEVAIVYWLNHIHQDARAMYQALHLLFGADHEPAMPDLPTFRTPRARDYTRAAAEITRVLPRTRQLRSWGGPPRGEARHVWAVTEIETLRRIARRHSVTVNDVYLAALAGSLRAWSLPEWLDGRRPLHAMMPISVRVPGESRLMSNFAIAVRVALPCHEPDPVRRLARIAEETRRIKAGGSVAAFYRQLLDKAPAGLPSRVLAGVIAASGQRSWVALLASNAGTLSGPLAVAGRNVVKLIAVPPLFVGRHHLAVLLCGLGSQACVGFSVSASVPCYAELPDLWHAELTALGGTAPRRRATAAA